ILVTVGTPVTGCPPHRSVRAVLPHTAPTSGIWRQSECLGSLTHPVQSGQRSCPALHPVRGFLFRVPLGRYPSLHRLRRGFCPLVRQLLRYYDTVRPLGGDNHRITAISLPCGP